MNLSDEHRHFFVMDQFVYAFFINVVINGVIAWLILRAHDAIPLWGDPAMAPDLLATGVLLPFLMCQIVSRLIVRQVAAGKLPALDPSQIPTRGLHRSSIHLRGLVLVVFATICASAPLVALLDLASAQPVGMGTFVAFKGLWAGLLAAMLSPPMAWWALASASEGVVAGAPEGLA